MGNIPQQPPAPRPTHGTIPPSGTFHSDMFLDIKKRKLSPSNNDEEVEQTDVKEAREKNEKPTKRKSANNDMINEVRVIRLTDVDPPIFGLFLKFIYRDSYPSNVDARGSMAQYHHRSLTAVPRTTTPTPTTAARPPFPNGNGPGQTTSPSSHMPTLMPPPPPLQGMNYIDSIPPSIHAWLLAQRQGALAFMIHAITNIHAGIGVYFALIPSLMDYVWRATSSSSNLSPPTTVTTVLSPSPLRKLLLDVLVTHWSHHNPKNPNAIVLRSMSVSPNFSTPLKIAWNRLFDKHTDLRNEFIHGLQGHVQMMAADAYFATPTPTAQSGMIRGGVAGSEFGKDHVRSGGQVEKEVVVKEEKKDETDGLTSEKG
ncbi:hypothetical protein G6011_11431 [Alternaria panax]|uniref:Uncharacterized protein n=1 Tax=Alternaria panax TaxID=48097 RepID=A0AAD4NRS8_9PLEO|nr:hypothetical protein G6011_11431 [Alternaria panax]